MSDGKNLIVEMLERPFQAMFEAAKEIGQIYNSVAGTDTIRDPSQVPYGAYRGLHDVYITVRNRGEELDGDGLKRFVGTLVEFKKQIGLKSAERVSLGVLSRSYELFLRQRLGYTRGERVENAQDALNEAHRLAGRELEAIGASAAEDKAVTVRRYTLDGKPTSLHPRDHEAAKGLGRLLARVAVNIHPAHVPIELIHGFVKICELLTKRLREEQEGIKFKPLFHKSLSRTADLVKFYKGRAGVWVDPTNLSQIYEGFLLWTNEFFSRSNLSKPARDKLDGYHGRVLSALRDMGVDVELPAEPKPAIAENGYAFTLNVEPVPWKVAGPRGVEGDAWESWLDFFADPTGGVEVTTVDTEILLQDVYRVAGLDPGEVSEETVKSFREVFSEQTGKHTVHFEFPHTLIFLENLISSKKEAASRDWPKEPIQRKVPTDWSGELLQEYYAAALKGITEARATRVKRAKVYAEIDEKRVSEKLPVAEEPVAEVPSIAEKATAGAGMRVPWEGVPFAMGEALSAPVSQLPGVVPHMGPWSENVWDGTVPKFSIGQRSVDTAPIGPGDTIVSESRSDLVNGRTLRRVRLVYLAGGLDRDTVTGRDVNHFFSVFVGRIKGHEQSAENLLDSLLFFAQLISDRRQKTKKQFSPSKLLKVYDETLKYISAGGIDRTMIVAGIRKPPPFAVKEVAEQRAALDRATKDAARKRRRATMWDYARAATSMFERGVAIFAGHSMSKTAARRSRGVATTSKRQGRAAVVSPTVVARATSELSYAILTGQVVVQPEDSNRSEPAAQTSVIPEQTGPGYNIVSENDSDFVNDGTLEGVRVVYTAAEVIDLDNVTPKDVRAFLNVFLEQTKDPTERSVDDFVDSLFYLARVTSAKRRKRGTKYDVNGLLREYAQTMKYISDAVTVLGEAAERRRQGSRITVHHNVSDTADRTSRGAASAPAVSAALGSVDHVSFAMGEALGGPVRESPGVVLWGLDETLWDGRIPSPSTSTSQASSGPKQTGPGSAPRSSHGGSSPTQTNGTPRADGSNKGGMNMGALPPGIDPRLAGAELLVVPPELSGQVPQVGGLLAPKNDRASTRGRGQGIKAKISAAVRRRRAKRARAAQFPNGVQTSGMGTMGATTTTGSINTMPLFRPPTLVGR